MCGSHRWVCIVHIAIAIAIAITSLLLHTPSPTMSAISKLTARDQELLPLAWLCLQGEVKIDFQKLAREGGFTNVGSASNAWARIAKKLAIPRGGSKSDMRAKYEAMSTNTSPKRKRGEKGQMEEEEVRVKKEKFRVRKEEVVVVAEMKEEEDVKEEEEEDEEEGPVKKRARARPRMEKEVVDGSREEEEDDDIYLSVSVSDEEQLLLTSNYLNPLSTDCVADVNRDDIDVRMSRRTNKRQGNAKMIYSRLPDLFLSSLPFSLSSFPLFPFHSLPFYIASSAKSLPLSSSSISCVYVPSVVTYTN